MSDDLDDVARAIIADSEMQEAQSYLSRGREFASLSVEDLSQRWAAAFTAVALGDDVKLDEWADLAAEFRLRSLPLPEDLVQGSMEALRKRISESTPEHSEAVRTHVSRRRAHWEKPKN